MGKAKVLTKDEIKRVMRIADTANNGLRDRVALSLSILAGMRIGEIAAYEISKELPSVVVSTETPLGTHQSKVLAQQPVLATILRAGLPMHNGLLNYFDKADNSFISAYRKHHPDGSFEICLEYNRLFSITLGPSNWLFNVTNFL